MNETTAASRGNQQSIVNASAPKERPILFSAPMVRVILEGHKTQTRRIVKIQPPSHAIDVFAWHRPDIPAVNKTQEGLYYDDLDGLHFHCKCPYGNPGDRIIVRERCAIDGQKVAYYADAQCGAWCGDGAGGRIWIHHGYVHQCENYRLANEPVRTLSLAEYGGKWRPSIHMPRWASRITLEITAVRVERLGDISEADAKAEGIQRRALDPWNRTAFARLWESINGPGSWNANPWVWVVKFKRV